MKTAAIYARYSSDNQREESIEAQIRAIREYAEKNNIAIVKIYVDEAKSATTDDRPQFLQMISDSKTGLFEYVIVHKLDRFARNRYDSAFYKRQLKLNGIRLISVLEQFDDSPESVILESVLEGMAEYYSRNLAREVIKGLKENAYECKFCGGIPPLGYNIDENQKFIINEYEAEAVRYIYSAYLRGETYGKIITWLNESGYKTKRGKPFGKNSLHEILKNEKYTGVYIFNPVAKTKNRLGRAKTQIEEIIRIEGGIPAIIDKETFEKVKKKMEENKIKPGANKIKETYLLNGLIYCGKCGSAMVVNTKKARGKKYFEYECSMKKRTKQCGTKAISRQKVEDAVLEDIGKKLLSPENIKKIALEVVEYAKEKINASEGKIEALQRELNNTVMMADRLMDKLLTTDNPALERKYEQKIADLSKKQQQLEAQILEAKNNLNIFIPTPEQVESFLSLGHNIKEKSPDDQKEIIRAYVKKVVIYEDKINIEYVVDFNGSGEPYYTKTTTIAICR